MLDSVILRKIMKCYIIMGQWNIISGLIFLSGFILAAIGMFLVTFFEQSVLWLTINSIDISEVYLRQIK